MNKTTIKKTTVREQLDAEKSTQPVELDRDNGTQTFEDSKTEKVTAPVVVQGAAEMDSADPTALVYKDYVETPVVVRELRTIDEGNMANIIESYKKSNPKKYASKKAELDRKLAEARKGAK